MTPMRRFSLGLIIAIALSLGACTTTPGEFNLSLPAKKGDSVWLQVDKTTVFYGVFLADKSGAAPRSETQLTETLTLIQHVTVEDVDAAGQRILAIRIARVSGTRRCEALQDEFAFDQVAGARMIITPGPRDDGDGKVFTEDHSRRVGATIRCKVDANGKPTALVDDAKAMRDSLYGEDPDLPPDFAEYELMELARTTIGERPEPPVRSGASWERTDLLPTRTSLQARTKWTLTAVTDASFSVAATSTFTKAPGAGNAKDSKESVTTSWVDLGALSAKESKKVVEAVVSRADGFVLQSRSEFTDFMAAQMSDGSLGGRRAVETRIVTRTTAEAALPDKPAPATGGGDRK